jgi:hypothetical protein
VGRASNQGNLSRDQIDPTGFADFSFRELFPLWVPLRVGHTLKKVVYIMAGNVVTIPDRDICRLTDATKCFINSF